MDVGADSNSTDMYIQVGKFGCALLCVMQTTPYSNVDIAKLNLMNPPFVVVADDVGGSGDDVSIQALHAHAHEHAGERTEDRRVEELNRLL